MKASLWLTLLVLFNWATLALAEFPGVDEDLVPPPIQIFDRSYSPQTQDVLSFARMPVDSSLYTVECIRDIFKEGDFANISRKLTPLLILAENETGARGNGDVVFLQDGSLRFVDLLKSDEIERVQTKSERITGLADSCSPNSFKRFVVNEDVRIELSGLVNRLAKAKNWELIFWIGSALSRLEDQALVTNYAFPRHRKSWGKSGKVPTEALIPVDFNTSLLPVFVGPLFDRLPPKDQAAALVHSAIRLNTLDRVGKTEPLSAGALENITRRIIDGTELKQVEIALGLDQAKILHSRLFDKRGIFGLVHRARSSLSEGRLPPSSELSELGTALKKINRDFFLEESRHDRSFRMFYETQTLEAYKSRGQESFEADNGFKWQVLLQYSNDILRSKAIQNNPALLPFRRELARFYRGFSRQYGLVEGNKKERQLWERLGRDLMILGQQRSDGQGAICDIIDGLLSADPSVISSSPETWVK